MSQQTGALDITFKASSDLSSNQYCLVKMSGSGTPHGVELTGADSSTDVIIGVLQNEPDEEEAAVVRVLGTSKVKVDGSVSIGDLVGVGTPAGYAHTADTDKDIYIGIALEEASTSGDIIEVLLTGPVKASI